MTLVTLKQLLTHAQKNQYAVGAFNINNLEFLQAVIAAGEKLKSPVIISTSEGAIQYAGMHSLCDMIIPAAKRANIPIALHFDHGKHIDVIKQALRSGYTSVMYDGSNLRFDENITNTRRIVRLAHAKRVSVEGELGTIGGAEDAVRSRHIILTEPDAAAEFVKCTGVDALAVAIGTSHGAHKFVDKSKLDIKRLQDIAARVRIPLVLHGASEVPKKLVTLATQYGAKITDASGVVDTQIRAAVRSGICKVNEDTDLRLAWIASVRQTIALQPSEIDPRKVLGSARDFVQRIVEDRIKILGSVGRA